ncbi:DUF11 domain-containing protein [Laspinema olomoucense]|uniref:DUF11 domain-containing protein n=1 Tax=Laspinema olomoucense D3b TaxID=2953688 RepID=A0ABT2N7U7_9CYAN|nr:DUF11 domain-containing protein [Laspinema sp. D3b]MCT7978760.1 DUF11 domain-containing protein [Laspinema sp. D3b]
MKRIAITHPLFLLQCFIVALSSCVLPSLPAHAEGSLQLVYDTDTNSYRPGKRPYLQFLPGTTLGGIQFSTTIKVYAQNNETLNLGSSAMGRGPNGDIIVRPPTGGPVSCLNDIKPTVAPAIADFGRIDNPTEELNGPFPTTGGYRPCVINVNQTGVWEIDFVSPNFANAANPADSATNEWTQLNNVSYVAAWDVTVRNNDGVVIPGRAFTNSLAMITGDNDRSIHSNLFVQTTDGYQYRVDLNGLDPNGFVFFANNKGFLEASTRNPLYRSIGLNAGFALPPGVTLHLPTTANNPATGDSTHQIFFNPPDTAVRIATLNIDNINNFRFEGSEGNTLGQAGTSPLGGSFKFTPPSAGTATLTIDANGNNSFNDPEDVQLTQYVLGGLEAQIFWDGRDRLGNVVPPRNIPYRVQLTFPFGEVHFPLIDPENDSNGIIIERLNPTPDFTLYFNDDTTTLAPGPINAGQNNSSSDPRPHRFSGLFGDLKGIDRWTFFTPRPVALTGGILIAAADLKITKTRTPDPAVAGGNITYTITVTNAGPSNITAVSPARVSDIFTANGDTVINLNWTCAITTPNNTAGTCIDATGTGNLSNARLALNAGASAQYTLTGIIIPTATQAIVNQATVTRPNDVADPVNDDTDANNNNNRTETATVTVPLTSGSPLLGVAKAAGTPIDNGDRTFTIPYTLVVRNYGNLPLTTLQVTENLNETFANLTYILEPNSLSSPTLTVNPSFNGTTDTNLLEAGNPNNTLAVDTEATINFAVRVTPGNNLGPFNNQVTASGVTPGGTGVNDSSTNGANPLGNNTGDPTQSNEVTPVTLRGNPNLELEKRITRVNGAVVGQSENLPDWPTNLVRGVASSNTIQPGDEVEYTIYFLSAGSGPLENATVCDPLQDFQTFRTDTFNGQTPTEGTFGAEVGIALALNPPNPDLPTAYLRSANSASNRGRFYPSGTTAPPVCRLPNVRGAVVVDLGRLGVGDYGFIRFRVRID